MVRPAGRCSSGCCGRTIVNFNGAMLHADLNRSVSNEDLAKAMRYLSRGLRDLAQALKP
jgi:hypothetical protein